MIPERFLSPDELDAFLNVARGRKHYVLFVLLATLGLRPSEALALKRSDIHASDANPWIRVVRLKKRKANPEPEELPLPPRLAELLTAHVEPFGESDRVFATNRRSLYGLFKHYARIAGLWHRRSLYVLRHTAATRMYSTTRDIRMVQAMLGHDNPSTSCIYAHVPSKLLADVVSTMPVVV